MEEKSMLLVNDTVMYTDEVFNANNTYEEEIIEYDDVKLPYNDIDDSSSVNGSMIAFWIVIPLCAILGIVLRNNNGKEKCYKIINLCERFSSF